MTLLTLAFDMILVGTALWLGSAVLLDALRDRRPQVSTMRTRRQAATARRPRVRSARAEGAVLARP
jgi:hypothetical protein